MSGITGKCHRFDLSEKVSENAKLGGKSVTSRELHIAG